MRVRLTAELDPKAKKGRPDLKTGTTRLYAVLCGNASRHVGMAGANGLAGRCLSLDMRR